MVIKRFKSIVQSKRAQLTNSFGNTGSSATPDTPPVPTEGDSPEANAQRSVTLFCESGGSNSGDEVLHLPVIVDAAESSPAAAAVAATTIRKFLSKENSSRAHVQYNAVMLIRILVDNPGPTFTRNVDAKFVAAVKDLLRHSRDPSVQQIVRETIGALYREKAYDANLTLLFQMWDKEQAKYPQGRGNGMVSPDGQGSVFLPPPNGSAPRSGRRSHSLPEPAELSARIEEARTSAKLLQQLVQSSSSAELQSNDLIKEFADRCQTAQRSVQHYISADNPPPDDDTMQTLIETTEQLSLAMSKHSRALLQARRANASASPPAQGIGSVPETQPPVGNGSSYAGTGAAPALSSGQEDTGRPSYAIPPTDTTSHYSPPPMPPPPTASIPRRDVVPSEPAKTGLAAAVATRDENSYSPPPLPPPNASLNLPPPPTTQPPPQLAPEEDPFGDDHETPPPAMPPRPGQAAAGGTPSYVKRQESAQEHLTMHGGRENEPVSPEAVVMSHQAGPLGHEPLVHGHGGQHGDVSPVYPVEGLRAVRY